MTRASSRIGYETAKLLGYVFFGLSRSPAEAKGVISLVADVRDQASVRGVGARLGPRTTRTEAAGNPRLFDVSVVKQWRQQRRAARDRSSTAISLAQALHSLASARAELVGTAQIDKSRGREGH